MREAVVFAVALTLATFAASQSYSMPDKMAEFSTTLATITSILIAVSLAVSAIVASPFVARTDFETGDGEAERIARALLREEKAVLSAQAFLFYFYLASLATSLILWWVAYPLDAGPDTTLQRILSGAASFLFVFSFILSARLPLLMKDLMEVRRHFGV